ncbi:expressed unknown protein [Ectocarpus siliculosus]|uniref:Uncharacterized protein n=1 Tax=Ectocarpus siliculosus TaxID=2880 RepID=D7FTV6_ECTSI|nr:expressed unknown protein [Ectocarpus siliculosus]|eukprot:CBJ31483.1 expressed unknown protein [Ectocarpus siliculosus]
MRGNDVTTALLVVAGCVAEAWASSEVVDPTAHMMRGLLTTGATTSSSVCAAEAATCIADDACTECHNAYLAAFDVCAGSSTSSSSPTCEEFVAVVCCAIEQACSDNAEHMEILDCAYGYIFGYDTGCDLADCSEDGSRAISGSDTPTESTSTIDTTTPGFMGGSDTTTDSTSTTDTSAHRVSGGSDSSYEHTFTTYTTPGFFSDSGTTTSTTSTWCPNEYLACVGDSACAECYQSFWDSWLTCDASVISVASSNGCDVLEDIACCAVDGCQGNELMVAYFDCAFAADSECAVEVGACAEDGNRAISGSDTSTESTSTTDTSAPGVSGGSDSSYTEHTFTTYTTPGFFSDSGTTTSTTSTWCPNEYLACVEDSACADCYQSFWDSWLTCDTSVISVASSNGCDVLEDIACCAVDGCQGNELMVAYFDCAFAADSECAVEVGACAEDGSRAISGSDTSTDSISTTDTTTTGNSSVVFPTTTTTSAFSSDSVSMTNDTAICVAENDACTADPTCLACAGAILSSQEVCQGSDFDSETATCDEKQEANCCALEGGTDCENNVLLGALYDCSMAAEGCTGALTDCLDGSRSASTGSEISVGDDDGSGGGGGGSTGGGDPSPAPVEGNNSEIDDDEGTSEVDPVPVEGDDDQEGNSAGDADAADPDASSASPSATAVGGSTAATGATLLLVAAAGAPGLWRRFQ